jgi:hypothetical protein
MMEPKTNLKQGVGMLSNDHVELEPTKIETKYKDPGRFDIAPYGQIWKVVGENDTIDYWLQVSKYEAEPCWILITFFFDKNFQELLRVAEFQTMINDLF